MVLYQQSAEDYQGKYEREQAEKKEVKE